MGPHCQNHFKLNDTIKQIVTMTDTIPADKDTGTEISGCFEYYTAVYTV